MSWMLALVAAWAGMLHLSHRGKLVVHWSRQANLHLVSTGCYWSAAMILIA